MFDVTAFADKVSMNLPPDTRVDIQQVLLTRRGFVVMYEIASFGMNFGKWMFSDSCDITKTNRVALVNPTGQIVADCEF